MRVLHVLYSLSPLTCPSFPPSSTRPDGLPLTEHWHQMCSSGIDSETSWAQCASGSVNENGCALCVHVCVSVAHRGWQLGNSVGDSFSEWATASCSSTHACSKQQHALQGWTNLLLKFCRAAYTLKMLLFICLQSFTSPAFLHTWLYILF